VSTGREQILSGIRTALGRGPLPADGRRQVEQRLNHPQPHVVPERGQGPASERLARFIEEAQRVNATVECLSDSSLVPNAIARYLAANNLPARIKLAPAPALTGLPWMTEPLLDVISGKGEDTDRVTVTPALAGVAETGTLVLLSGPESPTTLNFLPEAHIVLLEAGTIVGPYEDVWTRLRADPGCDRLPRVINWITGPSRTADIEQTLLLGAHGPRRLHILIVDGPSP
jgi:L-lactate dehydrogenase complex protein LldG